MPTDPVRFIDRLITFNGVTCSSNGRLFLLIVIADRRFVAGVICGRTSSDRTPSRPRLVPQLPLDSPAPRQIQDDFPNGRCQSVQVCDQLAECLVIPTPFRQPPHTHFTNVIWKRSCVNLASGAIPADRFAPACRAGILAQLDRWANEHRRFSSLWRSARRSHRPVCRTETHLMRPSEWLCTQNQCTHYLGRLAAKMVGKWERQSTAARFEATPA